MQYKFRLDKMHCAGCALALEQNINTLEGVEAKINFVTKVIELNIDTDNPAETLTQVKVAIKKFDHMVEILPYEEELDESTAKKYRRIFDISRFAIAVLLMLSNIVISTACKEEIAISEKLHHVKPKGFGTLSAPIPDRKVCGY